MSGKDAKNFLNNPARREQRCGLTEECAERCEVEYIEERRK